MFSHDMPWLDNRTSRSAFLETMAGHFPKGTGGYKLIEKAELLTFPFYKDTKRHNGEPACWHYRGNSLILTERVGTTDPREVVTEIIHDNREDFKDVWTHEYVETQFGHVVDQWLSSVTKLRKGPDLSNEQVDDHYFERFSSDLQALEQFVVRPVRLKLKLPDVLYNELTLDYRSPKGFDAQRRKLRDINKHWLPLARKYGILVPELESATRQATEFLGKEAQAA